jgi:hypothetical protein
MEQRQLAAAYFERVRFAASALLYSLLALNAVLRLEENSNKRREETSRAGTLVPAERHQLARSDAVGVQT